jgi:hypothetical protein
MDMQLQPVYADEASDSGVKVSPQVQQNLGIRTAVVKKTDVSSTFDAVGYGAVRRAPQRCRADPHGRLSGAAWPCARRWSA